MNYRANGGRGRKITDKEFDLREEYAAFLSEMKK